jgi:16S rRNA (guanine527-N7)-methyltransferase
LLDVGTGAGFPGLPLAVLNPGRETVLLDSAGKKVRFLRHVVRKLELAHVTPLHERVEDFEVNDARTGATAGTEGFLTITSRAFCTLAEFARSTRHLAGPDTRLLAMKGQDPAAEIRALPRWAQLCAVEPLSVPGLQAQRHLVIMTITPND